MGRKAQKKSNSSARRTSKRLSANDNDPEEEEQQLLETQLDRIDEDEEKAVGNDDEKAVGNDDDNSVQQQQEEDSNNSNNAKPVVDENEKAAAGNMEIDDDESTDDDEKKVLYKDVPSKVNDDDDKSTDDEEINKDDDENKNNNINHIQQTEEVQSNDKEDDEDPRVHENHNENHHEQQAVHDTVVEEEEEELPELAIQTCNHYYKVMYDMIDYHQEHIFHYRDKRQVYMDTIKVLLESHPPLQEVKFGRTYVRLLLCGILIDACALPAYEILIPWKTNQWIELLHDMKSAWKCILRKDSRRIIIDNINNNNNASLQALEDSTIDEHLLNSFNNNLFDKEFKKILKIIRMNQIISPIRKKLERQIIKYNKNNKTGLPRIEDNDVKMVFKACIQCDDEVVQSNVAKLFRPLHANSDGHISIDDCEPVLKNLEELKDILGTEPFCLNSFQHLLEQLIVQWNSICYGDNKSILFQLQYDLPLPEPQPNSQKKKPRQPSQTTPTRKERKRAMIDLQNDRKRLDENHGPDPLMESRQVAKMARNVINTTAEQHLENEIDEEENDDRKPAAHTSPRDDDVSDKENPDSREGSTDNKRKPARLSTPPPRKKVKKTRTPTSDGKMKYNGPGPDEGIFDEAGNVIRRKGWSDEEVYALLSGLETYNVGQWLQIKCKYSEILRNRTTVQIKDKYRNMLRKKEIPEELLLKQQQNQQQQEQNNNNNNQHDE